MTCLCYLEYKPKGVCAPLFAIKRFRAKMLRLPHHHLRSRYRTKSPMTIMLISDPGSQSALAAFGGYVFPSLSTCGVQMQRSACGILSMTLGICCPHPHQEIFSRNDISNHCFGGGGLSYARHVVHVPCLHILSRFMLRLCVARW